MQSQSQHQSQSPILITLLVLVIALVVLIAYLLYRRWNITYFHDHESLRLDTDCATTTVERRPNWFHSRRLSLNHSASKITPFLPAQSRTWSSTFSRDFSRLAPPHVPGTKMRLATRRHDGAWVFSDLDAASPFSPQGSSELSPSPSTTSRLLRKELLEMRKRMEMLGVPNAVIEPPPAYTRSENSLV